MKNILLSVLAIFILAVIIFYSFKLFKIKEFERSENLKIIENNYVQPTINKVTRRNSCLNSEEKYDFIFNKEKKSLDVYIISNKERLYEFTVNDVTGGYGIEYHKCGFYVNKEFGFDYITQKSLSDYRVEVWRYQADGEGNKLITLTEQTPSGVIDYYMLDYIVDENESYMVLEYPYKSPDFIVIKDVSTGKDLFIVTKDELVTKYHIDIYNPELLMIRSSWEWNKDFLYFSVYPDGDFFRVNMSNKTLEYNPNPPDYSNDTQG